MARNDFCSNYLAHSFLAHHGVLGMKWGVRRYQNPDGTLTDLGRHRYGRDSIPRNVLRSLANTSVGQRLAVNLNKGYLKDKKEIRSLYKEKKAEIKSKMNDTNKEEIKGELKSLKSDYKKTKGEARTTAAQINYDWQNPKTNETIQTQSIGKAVVKSILLGPSGSRAYDYVKGNGAGKGEAVVRGLFAQITTNYTSGVASIADYVVGKSRANKAGGYKERDKAAKIKEKEIKAAAKEAGKKAEEEIAKKQKSPLTSTQSINNASERGVAYNKAAKASTIKSKVEYARNTGKYDMEFLEKGLDEGLSGKALDRAYEEFLEKKYKK